MTPEPPHLDELRSEFPLWQFGTIWGTVHPGERRNVVATRDAVLLSAPDPASLREKVTREEKERGWPSR